MNIGDWFVLCSLLLIIGMWIHFIKQKNAGLNVISASDFDHSCEVAALRYNWAGGHRLPGILRFLDVEEEIE